MLSVSTSGKSRFQNKLDKIFWFVIMLLPLVFWLVLSVVPVRTSVAPEDNTMQVEEVESTVSEEVSTYGYKYAYRIVITPDAWTPVDWDWENFRKATNGEVYDMEGYLKFGDVESERFIVHLKDSEYSYNSSDTNFILMQTGYSSFNVNLLYPIRALFSEPVCGIEDWFVAGDYVEGVIYKGSFDFVFVDGGDVQRFTYNSDCNVYVNRWQVLVEDVEPETPKDEELPEVKDETEEYTYTFVSLNTVLKDYFGVNTSGENSGEIVYSTLSKLFGPVGVFPVFTVDSAMLYYMVYFVYVEILHVLIDVLVFIPRFAHKVLDKAINFGD